jgi:prepilin-type N-terminal cleavage/methylation domain-containing protein
MERSVLLDKRGMTLIEVLVATLLFLIVSLALLQSSIMSVNYNMRNVLRSEAVKIGDMLMSNIRNKPFTSAGIDAELTDTGGVYNPFPDYPTVTRSFRGGTVDFKPTLKVTDITAASTSNKQIDIKVSWTWNGATYQHNISTLLIMQE